MQVVAPGYEEVAAAFAHAVPADGRGGAFAAVVEGETVIDVWAGSASDDGRAWQRDTTCLVFSGTKGATATAALTLVESGSLDLEAPVAAYWPAFAAAGKADVRVRDVLAHTAGLPGIAARLGAAEIADPEQIFPLLAAHAPIVPIGAPSYHAVTFGWLVDAVVRAADGRPVSRILAEAVAGPLGLDLWIGVPQAELHCVAQMRRSPDYQLSAFAANDTPDPRLDMVYGLVGELDWNAAATLQAEIPAANGVATARSLARLYGCLARGGEIDGVQILAATTIDLALREASIGDDPLSGRLLRFGLGYELAGTLSNLGPAPDAFGHTGAGGSSHGAWPALRTGFSFVTSEMRTESSDDRVRSILAALHAAVRDP